MGIAEDWADLMFNLDCLSKGSAKRKFRKSIKYGWGGLCAYCRSRRATTLDHLKPREKDIIIKRRLMDNPKTLECLSQEYNVSRERIRQIETRAFEKLQTAVKLKAKELNLVQLNEN